MVFEDVSIIITAYREAGRPLDEESLALIAETSEELQDLALGPEWVMLEALCRVCKYREDVIVPLAGDLDNLECSCCGNMSSQEIDQPEWWQE